MKKSLFLAVVAGATAFSAMAQTQTVDPKQGVPADASETIENDRYGFHPSTQNAPNNNGASRATGSSIGKVIGTTIYDLQSNSSIDDRMVRHADGTISAVYTMSKQSGPGYTDRGTGYLYYDGKNWSQQNPTARLEPERIGWPSIGATKSGKEIIISHSTATDQLVMLHRATKGTGAWTTVFDPNGAKADKVAGTGYTLWPRMAIGGKNGETVHLIALSEPVGDGTGTFNGQRYMGIDGAICYSRSLDGGTTWDKKSIILPGLDSTKYDNFNADSYAIYSRGDVVAVAVFHRFNHTTVLKSTDNGDTWTTMYAVKFPFDNYVLGDVPITDTIATADNAGDVIIDANGEVHVMFGTWTWEDTDTSDRGANGGHQYITFPFMNGLNYWKESYGDGNHVRLLDLINNDGDPNQISITGGIGGLTDYGAKSLNSYPVMGFDNNGHLFATFMAVMESSGTKDYHDGTRHYRHQFVIKSTTGGCTWGEPMDLTDDGSGYEECVYGAMPADMGDSVRIIYMEDLSPGTAVGPVGQGGNHSDGTNEMVYVSMGTSAVSGTGGPCLTVIKGERQICPGDSIWLDASPSCGSAYSWNNGATTSGIWVKTTGTYSCEITTPCGKITEEVEVTTPPLGQGPQVSLTADNMSLCPSGSQTTLRVSHSSIGSSGFYEWNNSGSTTTIDTALATTPGTYNVKVTNCVGGISTATIVISAVSKADASVTGGAGLCPGDSTTLVVADNPAGSYAWRLSGSSTVISNARSLVVTQTGTYVVDVQACNGQFSAKDSAVVAVEPSPTATLSSVGLTEVCKGDPSITLIVSGQTGATYKWEDGTTNNTLTIETDSVLTHPYKAWSYNACGDSIASNSITVKVKPIPGAPTISFSSGVYTASAKSKWYFGRNGNWTYSGVEDFTWQPTNLNKNDKVVARTVSDGCESENSNELDAPQPSSIKDINSIFFGMKVFPNPNNGSFNIEFVQSDEIDVTISVRNIVGQEILVRSVEAANQHVELIDLNGVEAGIYMLSVSNGKETVTQRILVK